MSKPENSRQPTTTKAGREVKNDSIVCAPKTKKVVYEIQYETYLGEQIPYILVEGIKRYPVNGVGRLLGYDEKNEYQLYRDNKAFLEQFTVSCLVTGKRYTTSVPCINSTGLLIMTGKAPLKNMDQERQDQVVLIVQYMAESADLRARGELVHKDSIPSRGGVDRLGGEYEDHSFLNRLCIEVTRKERRRNPHGGIMSEQEMFKEDFDDINGPIPFVTRWRNKLDKLNGKKLAAKKVFVIHEMLSKNTEKSSLRKAVIKTFEEICPDLMPDFMPRSKHLDQTRQMPLMAGEEA